MLGNIIGFLKLVESLRHMVFWYVDPPLWGSAWLQIIYQRYKPVPTTKGAMFE